MKRVTAKVRDIVEVCPFSQIADFSADPELTLSGYRFTDITAQLMAKWLDSLAEVRSGRGAAGALAGFRGVGKSHFLAAFGSLAAHPDLRSKVSDGYVATSAERLPRRHISVARVRRGSDATLLLELKGAIADLLQTKASSLSDSLNDLLLRGAEKAGDSPLVLIIDTAAERHAHVSRDDGVILGEIAAAAQTLGIFVALALDDDISGADGANLAISSSYRIDYLDQEHLYKIVDSHVFSKNRQMGSVLDEIYEYYRAAIPGFRWSRERFSSLYPLHPAILEIAPLIRLYIQDFALLGFAADAGMKILGRPADSLIGLDEVFDSVEHKLRQVSDLSAAFGAYDSLLNNVVAKEAVQTRLAAKLLLKGLFMVSLSGQASSADEIAAVMMVYAEPGSNTEPALPARLLHLFTQASPEYIMDDGDKEISKYRFRLAAEADLGQALDAAATKVSDDEVRTLLIRHAADRFADAGSGVASTQDPTQFEIVWRGAIRRCSLLWRYTAEDASGDGRYSADISISFGSDGSQSANVRSALDIDWRLADLTPDESTTVRRFHALQYDEELRGSYDDGLATALQVAYLAVDRICQRVLLADGKLSVNGELFDVGQNAAVTGLDQILAPAISAILESVYPDHPHFGGVLSVHEAARTIVEFLGGSKPETDDAQQLAASFAVPLGLADEIEGAYRAVTGARLLNLDLVRSITEGSDNDHIDLTLITERLSAVGLTREAQYLVLAALVAQREYEFVTQHGNRINHRSLDLQTVWDDIVGIAKPIDETYSSDTLLAWAQTVTGNSAIRSLETTEDRLLIIDSLAAWLTAYERAGDLDRFEALPYEDQTASISKTVAGLRRSFGVMAASIAALTSDDVSLEQCLAALAEAFSCSEDEFARKKADLRVVRDFVGEASGRRGIVDYLAASSVTNNHEVERSRQALLECLSQGPHSLAEQDRRETQREWERFHELYVAEYLESHEAIRAAMLEHSDREILQSDQWRVLLMAGDCYGPSRHYIEEARRIMRSFKRSACSHASAEQLASRPHCACGFDLRHQGEIGVIDLKLRTAVEDGLRVFSGFAASRSSEIIEALVAAVSRYGNDATIDPTEVMERLIDPAKITSLTAIETEYLRSAIVDLPQLDSYDILSTGRSGLADHLMPPSPVSSIDGPTA